MAVAVLTCRNPKCGREIDVRERGIGWHVEGYERDRQQGGTNHVIGRRRSGEALCPGCITSILYGLDDGQEALDL